MTKQEYEAAIQSLDMELYASWLPDEGEKIADKRHELKEQYIASLEAKLNQLRKDNQALVEQVNVVGRKLENAIEILGDLGIRNCPMLTVNGYDCSNGKGCKHYHENTPTDTYACWTEYFKKGDKS